MSGLEGGVWCDVDPISRRFHRIPYLSFIDIDTAFEALRQRRARSPDLAGSSSRRARRGVASLDPEELTLYFAGACSHTALNPVSRRTPPGIAHRPQEIATWSHASPWS